MLTTRERPQIPAVMMDEINTAQYAMANLERSSISELNGLLKADTGLIPSGVGERAFVGLLNIYRAQDPTYSSQIFRFPIRHLVEDYVYPDRDYRASGKEIAIVVEQLDRIANTRLIAKTWRNHRSGRSERINAALIDYVKIVYEGDNNTPQTVEVAWGIHLWRSLQAKYTKKLDRHVYMSVRKPLDLRLYRWADSQLSCKPEQKVKSIQGFAKVRLGLKAGTTIGGGGRTASSYIAKLLEASVERLNGLGCPFRLIIDREPADFSLTFQRLENGPNQIVDAPDEAGDLLRHFAKVVHGTTTTRRRFPGPDRVLADAWIKAYGLEASLWMTAKAARLLRAETGVKAKAFRALEIYTDAARGAWEAWQVEQAGQQRLPLAETAKPPPSWNAYVSALFKREQDPQREKAITKEAEADLKAQIGSAWRTMGTATRRKMIESAAKTRMIEALGLLSEDAYEALDPTALEAELQKRHRVTFASIECT